MVLSYSFDNMVLAADITATSPRILLFTVAAKWVTTQPIIPASVTTMAIDRHRDFNPTLRADYRYLSGGSRQHIGKFVAWRGLCRTFAPVLGKLSVSYYAG